MTPTKSKPNDARWTKKYFALRDQALRQAVRRWKSAAALRAEGEPSSPEKRAAALAERTAIEAKRAEIDAEIVRREIAAGIPELRQQRIVLSKARTQASWDAGRYKFAVGFVDNIIGAFNIEGQGDTWEEAFAASDAKGKKGRDK